MRQQPIDSTIRPGGIRETIKSAARTEGEGPRRVRLTYAGAASRASCRKFSPAESFNPPIIPPGGLRIPPVRPQKVRPGRLESDQNFDHFLDSILGRFGSSWGPKLGSFSALLAPKIVPRRVLRPLFFEKVDFSKNERHPRREHDFDPQDRPRCGQDRPKTAPRGS